MGFGYKKVLLIGATSGIGLALADKFVEEGIEVVVGRRKENFDALVSKHGSDKASSFVFDLTMLSEIPSFAAEATKAHPDIDSVFMNSGIQRGMNFTKPERVDLNSFDLELTTNYTALIYTTSGLAMVPILSCANYCATKAALHHFILVLRQQMKNGGFNVNIIELYPPAVQTELHDEDKQPHTKNGRQFGMPLDDFVKESWQGFAAGEDQIAVGSFKRGLDSWEQERQKDFRDMLGMMTEANKSFYAY